MDTNRRIGSYIVERELGTGGMATVYLVRHTKLGSKHALKGLHSIGGDADARLQLEGRLQANVAHSNIVRVTDMIDVESRTGLVMEYVPGPTLSELIARQVLTVDETVDLGAGILAGLAAAHHAGRPGAGKGSDAAMWPRRRRHDSSCKFEP